MPGVTGMFVLEGRSCASSGDTSSLLFSGRIAGGCEFVSVSRTSGWTPGGERWSAMLSL